MFRFRGVSRRLKRSTWRNGRLAPICRSSSKPDESVSSARSRSVEMADVFQSDRATLVTTSVGITGMSTGVLLEVGALVFRWLTTALFSEEKIQLTSAHRSSPVATGLFFLDIMLNCKVFVKCFRRLDFKGVETLGQMSGRKFQG